MAFGKEVIAMCPWVEQFGFCPYGAASKTWQWVQSLFS